LILEIDIDTEKNTDIFSMEKKEKIDEFYLYRYNSNIRIIFNNQFLVTDFSSKKK